ncbi:uncharacterized protein LOC112268620 [Brachypodium distachyon]|nr:uncharacterized protein LOC112268620 [Brachypodium distachyon]PNT75148.1 hypothetical protein BRADI_1g28198v3 [Brachypodium distachyon]|eukprot:XP_024310269.1 uncharacterized protein LOC112268620 [Brachypodium distachyon]
MPPNFSSCTLRSVQGRFETIKSWCSCWSGCLEQVRNASPSGCTIMIMYKAMPGSKERPFTLQHCWKVLEFSEKWRLRDKEAAPKKGAFVQLDDDNDDDDDDEENDAPKGGRDRKKPDGRKKEKEKIKKTAESSSLNSKFDELTKSKEIASAAKLEVKKINAEKKHGQKL